MIYEIHLQNQIAKMKLTYRIEDNKIISDQPSSPREEITNFRLENNKLELEINNKFYKYRRIN